MIAAMEGEFADAEAELRQEYEAQREEIKNRNSEEYNVLKIQLEGIIEELEKSFELVRGMGKGESNWLLGRDQDGLVGAEEGRCVVEVDMGVQPVEQHPSFCSRY